MTKNEFMTKLSNELRKRNISDAADILEEYEQHFAFKTADGYSEEEITAKLGNPEELAAQFGSEPKKGAKRSAFLTWLWLCWVDLFFGIFAVLLISWGIVMASAALSFGLTGICFVFNLGSLPFVALPPMPYWCGAIIGLSLSALCVLSVVGCIWFFAFIRQIFRSFGRFHQNVLAESKGAAVRPSLPIVPQFSPKAKRRLRSVALVSLMLFAVCFVLGFVACSLSAGNIQFWHKWGWFGYTNGN